VPDPESGLVVLVGENGAGKTNVLELLSLVAQPLGLAPSGRASRRQGAAPPAEFSVVIDLSSIDFDPEELTPMLGGPGTTDYAEARLAPWDRTLEFRYFPYVPPDDERPAWVPAGTAGSVVGAGGVPDSERVPLASAITTYLQTRGEVNLVFLDSDRAYGGGSVQDPEILEAARRDPREPDLIRTHAAALLSSNQYVEWIRAWLGLEQREALGFLDSHRRASLHGSAPPLYRDPFEDYRQAVQTVLPHLTFIGPNQERKTLIFETGGAEITWEDLSGGEREVAFLVGS
jgi:hypothetical protein